MLNKHKVDLDYKLEELVARPTLRLEERLGTEMTALLNVA